MDKKDYKEKVVSFQTAKLAKEKGFNIFSHSYYFEDGEFKEYEINETHGYYGDEYTVERSEFYENWNNGWKTTKEGDRCFGCDKNPRYLETFSAPTQCILQKWLRETHNIHIQNHYLNDKYTCKVKITKEGKKFYNNIYSRDSYEEALEAALELALKAI